MHNARRALEAAHAARISTLRAEMQVSREAAVERACIRAEVRCSPCPGRSPCLPFPVVLTDE